MNNRKATNRQAQQSTDDVFFFASPLLFFLFFFFCFSSFIFFLFSFSRAFSAFTLNIGVYTVLFFFSSHSSFNKIVYTSILHPSHGVMYFIKFIEIISLLLFFFHSASHCEFNRSKCERVREKWKK